MSQLEEKGLTWKGYFEDIPNPEPLIRRSSATSLHCFPLSLCLNKVR